MRFAIMLFCWVAFFGWNLAANHGAFVEAVGTRISHLIHLIGLV